MIAFQVSLNCKRVCTAGADDLSVLSATVHATGLLGKKTVPVRPGEITDMYYMVGGLTSRPDPKNDVHLKWKRFAPLKIGDVMQIKILETTQVDRPKTRTKAKRRNPKRTRHK